jgi:hypothetical protein
MMLLVTGGDDLSPESRAEYMKNRRKTIGQFSVSVPKEKLDALSEKLGEQNKTKTQWLNEKIDEELGK